MSSSATSNGRGFVAKNLHHVAVVCSSNMNRSMEAHAVFKKKGFRVASFGTGAQIKIPGASRKEPNCYAFGTTYDSIHKDLIGKDRRMYTENGMLHILDRNKRIKEKPENFQALLDKYDKFDLIITVEEKVYDLVIRHFEERDTVHEQPVHVINMDVVDNPEDATIGAFLLCELAQNLDNSVDLDDEIEEIVQEFEAKCKRPVMHTVLFY